MGGSIVRRGSKSCAIGIVSRCFGRHVASQNSQIAQPGGRMRKTTTRSKKALSRRTFVAAGALAAGGGFVPKRVVAQKKVQIKFTLGWLPEGANVWSYAAKQFWSKAGIEVPIEKGTGSAPATPA